MSCKVLKPSQGIRLIRWLFHCATSVTHTFAHWLCTHAPINHIIVPILFFWKCCNSIGFNLSNRAVINSFSNIYWPYLQLHNSIILYTHRPVCPCMLALPFALLCLFCLKQRLLYMGFNSSLEHVHENLGGAICCEHGWTIARCMLER